MILEKKPIIKKSTSLAFEIYSNPKFAKEFEGFITQSPYNKFCERPAMMSLLPGIKGKNVLDAGCGVGVYSEYFIEKGANVCSLDYSEQMLKFTKKNTRNRVSTYLFDLNDFPLPFSNCTFDVISSNLVIHYINDLDLLFSEFSRILKDDGCLLFSINHPLYEFDIIENDYFNSSIAFENWEALNVRMPFYHRSLETIFKSFSKSKFQIELMLEPKPLLECEQAFPEQYAAMILKPYFICFKLTKNGNLTDK